MIPGSLPKRPRQNDSLTSATGAPSETSRDVNARPMVGLVPVNALNDGRTDATLTLVGVPSADRSERSSSAYASNASKDRAFSFQARTTCMLGVTITFMPVWLPCAGSR
jgi:hypothetical protein